MPTEGDENTPIKLALPLSYQQAIFKELQTENELVVLGPGLGLLQIVSNLLHVYDATGDSFVIVLGASERESRWISDGTLVF